MREIKLRAWNKHHKEMTYKGYFLNFDGEIFFKDTRDKITIVEHLIPLQFTGLKDKNGKEIYEGDIVSYLNCYTKKMLRKQIIWDRYSCGFACDPLGHTNLWHFQEYLKDNKLSCEVIGNIYDNPELLK